MRILAGLVLLAGAWAAAQVADAGGGHRIEVAIAVQHDRGSLWVLLFDDPKAFPIHREKARQRIDVKPRNGAAVVTFDRLPSGAYAVAVVHDENGNGKIDTKIFGIPAEGLGASRDAKGFMSPPGFDAARVELKDQDLKLTINVAY